MNEDKLSPIISDAGNSISGLKKNKESRVLSGGGAEGESPNLWRVQNKLYISFLPSS